MQLSFGQRNGDFIMPEIIQGILLPFYGTLFGACSVLFINHALGARSKSAVNSFAAGVMTAASIFSLLIPAIEQAYTSGSILLCSSVYIGLLLGVALLLAADVILSKIERNGIQSSMSYLAITIHNLPEGMAVGVVFAAFLADPSSVSIAAALAVSMGIAIQNFPEGAITSLTLFSSGKSRACSFWLGALSGIVEPVSACIALAFIGIILPAMPFLLSFAAGAMIYVVISELIPESFSDTPSYIGSLSYTFGFAAMMLLDTILG